VRRIEIEFELTWADRVWLSALGVLSVLAVAVATWTALRLVWISIEGPDLPALEAERSGPDGGPPEAMR
jgi:hypothetical protein